MTDLCTDGRFELIEKYKKELIGITTAKNTVMRLTGRMRKNEARRSVEIH